MLRPAVALVFVGLAMPALAQGLPGLEGEGAQTQSVEAAKGAVAVTLDSSGSAALGGGVPEASGRVSLSVNGMEVGPGAGRPGEQEGASGREFFPKRAGKEDDTGEGVAQVLSSAAPTAFCGAESASADALDLALAAAYPLVPRQVTCMPEHSEALTLVLQHPQLKRLLLAHGIAPEMVTAIRIADESVIADFVIRE